MKLNENIVKNLSPNSITAFLKVYKELMPYFIVFPLFLRYLTNAEYMISSWPVVS